MSIIRGTKQVALSPRSAGIDWLLSKRIHLTARSANLWIEQQNYTYRTNPDGRVMPKPIDDFNHGIDAIRYGVSDWREMHGQVADWSASDLGL